MRTLLLFFCYPEQAVEQTGELSAICETLTLMLNPCNAAREGLSAEWMKY